MMNEGSLSIILNTQHIMSHEHRDGDDSRLNSWLQDFESRVGRALFLHRVCTRPHVNLGCILLYAFGLARKSEKRGKE